MQLIYQNFDKLDVTFQTVFPPFILDQLEYAKREAQEQRKPIPIVLGDIELPVLVGETGAIGGFSYRFSTGIDGEMWFASNSRKKDVWGIRVSVSSLGLALNGYLNTKNKIIKILNELCGYGIYLPNDSFPKERISRVDYCLDFRTPFFIPNPDHLIVHSGMGKNIYLNISRRGRHLETLRIGQLPGKQVTIYDKIKEINVSKKYYWFDFWNLNKKEFNEKIWRLEIRAGKKELDNHEIKRFSDLENNISKCLLSILRTVRYVDPTSDTNASRWPNAGFWDLAKENVKKCMDKYEIEANRSKILGDLRSEIIKRYEQNIKGNITNYAAALGHDISEMPDTIDLIEDDIISDIKAKNPKIMKKFAQAERKYAFYDCENKDESD